MMDRTFTFFLKNFKLFYKLEGEDISYDIKGKARVHIVKNVKDCFYKEKRDVNERNVTWKKWKGVSIPFLFDGYNDRDIVTYKDGKALINYDIVSSTFYFLSGWNEYVNSSKDEYGRMKYENSIVKRLGIINIPVVNYYFDILSEAIKKVYGKEVKKNVWVNYPFSACLTHDIDECKSAWLIGSSYELKKKRFFSIPRLVIKRVLGKDDWFNFEKIDTIEKQFNAISSYYFLPQKSKISSRKWKNADYHITDKAIQRAILFLKSAGNEVGVHGSFGTHIHSERLSTDIIRINSTPIIGNRFHFMMFDPAKTVSVLQECGIKYDTSLGFAEHVGFRRGTCYPFYLYDFEKEATSSVLEIPLIVMDGSLYSKKYMNVSREKALEQTLDLVDTICKFGGVFTLLWHNTFFSEYKYRGWKEVYCKILEHCQSKNGLLTSGEQIYSKLTNREV